MTLGEQIRRARENKNLSQEELAEQLGVSRQAVSKWENDTSVPQGINRELLSKLLELEVVTSTDRTEEKPVGKSKVVMWLGWGVAIALLAALGVSLWFNLRTPRADEWHDVGPNVTPAPPALSEIGSDENEKQSSDTEIPTLKNVQFYDCDKHIIGDVDGWYNSALFDTILIQWEGGTPNNIKVFYMAGLEEYVEQTELLATKNILDGDTAALFGANVLEPYTQGHFYFELDFGETVIVSDTYNMYYELEYSNTPRILYYVRSVSERNLTVDAVEWVDVPSSRFAELGLNENDTASGFLLYNAEEKPETFALSDDCICTVLDWTGNYEQRDVTVEELLQLLTEREGMEIPYELTIEGDEIIAFSEQYVP